MTTMMLMKTSLCLLRPVVQLSANQRWYQVQQEHRPQKSHWSSSPYKAVIFDMYGVLIPSPVKLAAVFEQRSGVPLGTLGQAIRAGGEKNIWKSFMKGELGAKEFVEAFGKQCSYIAGCPVPIGSFLAALTSGPMREPLPFMMEAIRVVRSRGLKTALLSNNFLTLEGQPFMPLDSAFFDVMVESCREGVSKPDARIYQVCLERLGVSPQEAVFLDDLPFNIQAAADLGLTAIKVEEPAAAVRTLEEVLGFPLSLSPTLPGACRPPIDRLTHYLRTHLHEDNTDDVDIQPVERSQSLYYLTCGGRHFFLRTQLPGSQALDTEYRILKALSGSALPVPNIIEYSEESSLGVSSLLMEVCPGRRFADPSLPGLTPPERAAVYQAMTQTLCQISSTQLPLEDQHSMTVQSLGSQVEGWIQKYQDSQTHPIPAMDRLVTWLPHHIPTQHSTNLVHGNFSLSKLLFHPERAKVVGVLDWGLASRGDPLLDLSSSLIPQNLPRDHPLLPGLEGLQLDQLGIPTTEDLMDQYCGHKGAPTPDNWRFYMALQLFRQAACLQHGAEQLAELAWDFATKEGFRVFNTMPRGKAQN